MLRAWSSSQLSDEHSPYRAWRGDSKTATGFFHSMQENNPWLMLQLSRRTVITSVTIVNRKDCCGEKLQELWVRGGLKDNRKNTIISSFQGPGSTDGVYVLRSQGATVVDFLSFCLRMENATLQINGIRLNEEQSVDHGTLDS